MAYDRGANSGITGLIDLTNGAKFHVKAFGFDESLSAQTIDVSGRGDNAWGADYFLRAGGNIVVRGMVQTDGFPLPTSWNGETGQLTLQLHTNVTETLTVRVTGSRVKRDDKAEDNWLIWLTCQISANPELTGFGGTQQTPDGDNPDAAKETWEGMGKTYDPKKLQHGATQRIALWGVSDTDAAEVAQMVTELSNASPITDLKARPAGLTRASANLCFMSMVWGFTDTRDDQILPGTSTTVDVSGLQSQANSAGTTIYGTTTSPVAPSGDTFVQTGTTTRKLHDNATLTVNNYALRTPKQAIEMDGTFTKTDPSDLESGKRQTNVYNTGASVPAAVVPPGQNLQATTISDLNPNRKQVVYEIGKDTSQQKAEQDATITVTDANNILTAGSVGRLDSSTFSGGYAIPANTVARELKTKAVTHDHTLYTQEYGLRSTKEDIEFPGSKTFVDVSGIESHGQQTIVYAAAAPNLADDTDAVIPSGQQIVQHYTEKVNQLETQKVWLYAVDTPKQKLEQNETKLFDDGKYLESRASAAALNGTPSTPSAPTGGSWVARGTRTEYPTHNSTLTIKEYGTRSTQDDIEMPGTFTTLDVSDVESVGKETLVYDKDNSVPAATVPSGLQKTATRTDRINSEQRAVVYDYAKDTPQQKLEQQHTTTITDASALKSEATTASLDGTPSSPGGSLVKRVDRTIKATNDHTLNVSEWGLTTAQQDVEYSQSVAAVDPLENTAQAIASIDDTTAALDTYVQTLLGTYKGDSDFAGLEVKRLTPAKVLTVRKKSGDDKTIRPAGFATRQDRVLGTAPGGWGSNTAYVRVARLPGPLIAIGGYTEALIQHQTVYRTQGSIHYRRRLIVSSLTELATAMHMELTGKVNNAAFLGMTTHNLMYAGPLVHYCVPITGGHLALIDYVFDYDSLQFQNETNLGYGWIPTALDGGGASILINTLGIVPALVYFGSNWIMAWPPEADFAPFTA